MAVDRNLEDDWLERLNALQAFELLSICEGHQNRRANFAHINLGLRKRFVPTSAAQWDEVRLALANELDRLFPASDTGVDVDLKFAIHRGTQATVCREDLTVRIRRRNARTTEAVDEATRRWFCRALSGIEDLDRLMDLLGLGGA